jgi:hypothetical protein
MKGKMKTFKVSLLLCFAYTAKASSPERISWSDFSTRMTPRHTIRLVLPDGTRVEGKLVQVKPDGMDLDVTGGSNNPAHSKGRATIPRQSVSVIGVRSPHRSGRLIGTILPIAFGALLIVAGSQNDDDGNAPLRVASGAALMSLGGIGGFFAGRAVDRQFDQFIIIPDRQSTTVGSSAP